VFATLEQAIFDGVDVINLSVCFGPTPMYDDVIARASFSAIEKGIVVVAAVRNK
jgi:hypothetical protein